LVRNRFLVVYNYGQGGLWGHVFADSPEQITQRWPELRVAAERPAWLDREHEAKLSAREEDIDERLGSARVRLGGQPADSYPYRLNVHLRYPGSTI
jgi:hypothetical protein